MSDKKSQLTEEDSCSDSTLDEKSQQDSSSENSMKLDNPKRRSKRINKKQKLNDENKKTRSLLSTMSDTRSRSSNGNSVSSTINKKTSKRKSNRNSQSEKELNYLIKECFKYEMKQIDFEFIKEMFFELPKLNMIWDRIGFNKETKSARLETFYSKLSETIHAIVDGEEDLEEKIIESIDEYREKIKELCLELNIKMENLKLSSKSQTILEQDNMLRSELNRLQIVKNKRLDEYKQLSIQESELCTKLNMNRTEIRLMVPTEQELNQLTKRIKDLNELLNQRKKEMCSLKDEIMQLSDDLELSRSDSFAELILFESADAMSLGENDLIKARDFRDDLKKRDNELTNEIKSLKVKIKELWSKLNVSNADLAKFINSTLNINENDSNEGFGSGSGSNNTNNNTKSKRSIICALRAEYEKCTKLKMENMHKFIDSVRVEIREFTKKMFIGKNEMKQLNEKLLDLTNYDDELLTRHEEKLEDLKFRYDEFEALYESTAKWMQVWSEFLQFEEKTKDPLRFKIRGYNMLEEEKQRKAFQSQLPKLEEDLTELATQFKKMNGGEDFYIYGIFYAEYIQRQKVDHDESKQNERREKQILRDNLKKNESRYGSKPITPLALRNKRKFTNQESQVHTPSNVTNQRSKLQKTDPKHNDLTKTPGSLANNSTRLGLTVKPNPCYKPKLSIAAKRKSRTPAKNRHRRSKLVSNKSKLVDDSFLQTTSKPTDTETVSSFDTNTAELTLKTTLSSVASSLFQTTTNITENLSSNMTNLSCKSTATNRTNNSNRKYPPPSASSKYSTTMKKVDVVNRMTSTASNTFIEDENIENIENSDETAFKVSHQQLTIKSTKLNENKKTTMVADAAARINKLIGAGQTSSILSSKSTNLKLQTATTTNSQINKLASVDVNYLEFTRDLSKPNRLLVPSVQQNQNTLTDSTNQLKLKGPVTRSNKLQTDCLTKNKLTSTLIKD